MLSNFVRVIEHEMRSTNDTEIKRKLYMKNMYRNNYEIEKSKKKILNFQKQETISGKYVRIKRKRLNIYYTIQHTHTHSGRHKLK